MPRLRYATKEQFLVILLNSKNKVIGTELVSEGSLTNSVVHPRGISAGDSAACSLYLRGT